MTYNYDKWYINRMFKKTTFSQSNVCLKRLSEEDINTLTKKAKTKQIRDSIVDEYLDLSYLNQYELKKPITINKNLKSTNHSSSSPSTSHQNSNKITLANIKLVKGTLANSTIPSSTISSDQQLKESNQTTTDNVNLEDVSLANPTTSSSSKNLQESNKPTLANIKREKRSHANPSVFSSSLSSHQNLQNSDKLTLANEKLKNRSFVNSTIPFSIISSDQQFKESNQTTDNVNLEDVSLANPTTSSSSKNLQESNKPTLANIKREKRSHANPSVFSSSLSSRQNLQNADKLTLANEKLKNRSFVNSTIPSSIISSDQQFQKSNLTTTENVHLEHGSLTNPTTSSSSKNLQKSNKPTLVKINREKGFLANSTILFSTLTSDQKFQKPNKTMTNNINLKEGSFSDPSVSSSSSSNYENLPKPNEITLALKKRLSANLEVNDDSINTSKNLISSKLSSENLVGKIRVKEPKILIKNSLLKRYLNCFFESNTKTTLINSDVNKNLSLRKFTIIFDKYFTEFVQQTVVIIANIANIILLYENFCNEKVPELQRNINNINLPEDHKFILVTKLQYNVMSVLSIVDDSEIDCVSQILFMCMLTILPTLHDSHSNFNDTFKRLEQLFCKNLQRSKPKCLKFINCIESEKFLSQCNKLIHLVEVSIRNDNTMKNRMAVCFKPKKRINHYIGVINALCNNSYVNLSVLINEATLICRNSYKLKDPHNISLNNPQCSIKYSSILLKKNTNDKLFQNETITASTSGNNKSTYDERLTENRNLENTNNTNLEINLRSSTSSTSSTTSENISSTLKMNKFDTLETIGPSQDIPSNTSIHHLRAATVATTSNSSRQVNCQNNAILLYPVLRPDNTSCINNTQHQPQSNMNTTTILSNTNEILVRNIQPMFFNFHSSCDADNCNNLGTIVCKYCCLTIYCSIECQRRHRELGRHDCNTFNNLI